jgi:hypothetical protein
MVALHSDLIGIKTGAPLTHWHSNGTGGRS